MKYNVIVIGSGPGGYVANLAAATPVKFYYDHASHWVTDNINSQIATAAGDFQSELGCAGDWAPDCLRSWLQDADGDGVYELSTIAIPAGNYEFKVALNESWNVAYPDNNVPFTVAAGGDTVTITWNKFTNEVTVDAGSSPAVEWVVAGSFHGVPIRLYRNSSLGVPSPSPPTPFLSQFWERTDPRFRHRTKSCSMFHRR